MAEIDPVILELIAKNDRYLAELRKTTRVAEQQMGTQERRVKSLERQMERSSGAIGSQFRRLAGILGTVFSGRELLRLADSFTRLQNNLRVAGLEGESLAQVQQSLLDISQRYGTDLEGLTEVFLKASLAQNELGASTQQIIRLNEIVAASLKVTGTSAAQAQGALLQLGQALGSGVVRAEEFNSILEGALPLAQAAARGIDGMGGSVAKLRAAVADGNITSQQFFQGVLRGGVQTLADAEKATLTLAGGVTALTSALTVYFGEADKANGVSAALGTALGKLAENLDIIIPALAAIATFLGVRYVAAAVAASGATRALIAHLSIATTSLAGTALAARSAGAALLAAFGGPVGVALLAIAGGLYLIHQRTSELDNATGRYADGLEASNQITDRATELANKLASARGKERDATLEALRVEKARAQQALISAKNDIIAARATLARAQAQRQEQSSREGFARGIGGMGMDGGGISTAIAGIPARQAQANLAAAEQAAKNIESGLEQISAIIAGASAGVAIPAADDKKKKKAREKTGPTLADIEARFEAELVNYTQQALGAMQQVARSAEERAELEMRSLEWARRQTLTEIAADEDYNAAQKAELSAAVERLAGYERDAIEFEKRRQLEQEARDLAEEQMRARDDQLRLAYDLATTEADRRSLALQILDAEDAYLRSKLEAVIASDTATRAEQERARIALASLNATAGDRQRMVERQHQGPLGRYLDSTSDPQTMAEAAAVREIEAVRDGLVDGLSEKLGVKNQFVKDMLSIFLEQNLFRPIAESLAGAGGGGLGGLVSSFVGSIFGGGTPGFARGGSMVLGGRGGTDNNLLSLNGRPLARVSSGETMSISPNQRLGAGQAPVVNQTFVLDARYGITTPQLMDYVNKTASAKAAEAGGRAYQQSMKDAPGRIRNAQRYGG